MKIDNTSWSAVFENLKSEGWTCDLPKLKALFSKANEETALRLLGSNWDHGEKAKAFVFSLVACAKRRDATMKIAQYWEDASGEAQLWISFPAGSRLQAMHLRVHLSGSVHVVRKFNGDWRSAKTFLKKIDA